MKGESIETPFSELFSHRTTIIPGFAYLPTFAGEKESALHYTGVFAFKDSF